VHPRGFFLSILFRQSNHLHGDVNARDLRGSCPFQEARVEPVSAGHVQHLFASNVSQDLEQRVPLDHLPIGELLGIPVGFGDGVVLFHSLQILRMVLRRQILPHRDG
jgi:hypothetical protein